ncbi:hypothetical protein ABIC50_004712 [Burkholderia sp. 567]
MTHVLVAQELSNARLVSKDGARVHFESMLIVKSAFRFWVPAPETPQDAPVSPSGVPLPSGPRQGLPQFNPKANLGLLGLLGATPAGEWKQVDKASTDSVSIKWSATLTSRRALTRARIDSLTFSE